MKRETLDRFLGKEVTIKLFDNKYYKGFFIVTTLSLKGIY